MSSSGAPRFTASPYQAVPADRHRPREAPPGARVRGQRQRGAGRRPRSARDRGGRRRRPARRAHRPAPPPDRAHPRRARTPPRAVAAAAVARLDLRGARRRAPPARRRRRRARSWPSTAATHGRRGGRPRRVRRAGSPTTHGVPCFLLRARAHAARGAARARSRRSRPTPGPPRRTRPPARRAVGARPRAGGLQRLARRAPTSPRPARSRPRCAARRCARSACRSATAVQVSMNLVAPGRARPGDGLRPRGAAGRRPGRGDRAARSWWASCPARCCDAVPTRPVGASSTSPRTGRSRRGSAARR